MTTTADIMALAEAYVKATELAEYYVIDEAYVARVALRTAVESLVAERDALHASHAAAEMVSAARPASILICTGCGRQSDDPPIKLPAFACCPDNRYRNARELLAEIDSLRAALSAPPGWQPIETAPKDGTPVLVWKSGWDPYHNDMDVFRYINRHWRSDDLVMLPTHWMPLPNPPAAPSPKERP